jgi:transposase
MARPSKLTPAVEERILKALRAGNYATAAAGYAGIHPSTFHRWLERGDPGGRRRADLPYRRFAEKVQQAIAEAEVRDVTLISKAAETEWRAAGWRLSRRHPNRWGQPTPKLQEATGATGPRRHEASRPTNARLKTLSEEELQLLTRTLGLEAPPAEHRADDHPWLRLGQAVWDELYDRKVGIDSQEQRDHGHELLRRLASTEPNLDDLEEHRNQIAARHGLPPRPR